MAKIPGAVRPNRLYYGDNLDVLRESVEAETVDLIYLDPPFNSNRSYSVLFKEKSGKASQAQLEAFDDTWTWSQDVETAYLELLDDPRAPVRVKDATEALRRLVGDNDVMAYLVMMTTRLLEMYRVLTPNGVLVLHCDPTASHYLKVVLDAIFGPESFVNEIIWQRTATKGDAQRKFGAVHDVLLAYSRGPYHTFNPIYVEQDERYIGRFSLDDDDGRGAYRLSRSTVRIHGQT